MLERVMQGIPVLGLVGLGVAVWTYFSVLKCSPGDEKMQKVASVIRSRQGDQAPAR